MDLPEDRDVEVVQVSQGEVESEHPLVTARELELNHVYVLHSETRRTFYMTMNYHGSRHMIHPFTLDAVVGHLFGGERANTGMHGVVMMANPDGSFSDFKGTRVTVRRYTGSDV